MNPREFFPNMPDEVFDMWLKPKTEEAGWPFDEKSDDVAGSTYEAIFKRKPLSFWRTREWARTELKAVDVVWTSDSQFWIRGVREGDSRFDGVSKSRERFAFFTRHVREFGDIPLPVVIRLDLTATGFDIIDGVHRLAALYEIGFGDDYMLPCWVTN